MNTAKFRFAPPRLNVRAVHNDAELLEAVGQFDLVVTTKMRGRHLPAYAQVVDGALDGFLERTTELVGPRGSQRVLWLEQSKHKLGALKYIQVVGLGDELEYDGKCACALVQAALHQAVVLNARKVAILVSPHRLTEDAISMKGIAAITRCRVEAFASRCTRVPPDELTLICSPQAHRHLSAGLDVEPPRCRVCTLPAF